MAAATGAIFFQVYAYLAELDEELREDAREADRDADRQLEAIKLGTDTLLGDAESRVPLKQELFDDWLKSYAERHDGRSPDPASPEFGRLVGKVPPKGSSSCGIPARGRAGSVCGPK